MTLVCNKQFVKLSKEEKELYNKALRISIRELLDERRQVLNNARVYAIKHNQF